MESKDLRLFMGPVETCDTHRSARGLSRGEFGRRYRWVTENGHPGACGPDCWHSTPDAALDCYAGHRGAARDIPTKEFSHA